MLIAGTQGQDWDAKPGDTNIQSVNVADGNVRQLTAIPDQTAHPAPSPDGRQLAFAVCERGMSHHSRRLFVVPATGGEPREVLPGFDRSIGDIAWAADGRNLFVSYDDAGAGRIARVGLDGGMTVLVRDASGGMIEMPYAGHGFSVAQDGTLVYVRSAADVPSEGELLGPTGGQPRSLTALNAGLASEVGGFRPADSFWVTGGDGRRVQCWLLLPPGAGPHPMVLEIHDGPYAQYGARFSIKHQAMAFAG